MGVMTLVNLLFVVLFYKELKLATFDPAWPRRWASRLASCFTRC